MIRSLLPFLLEPAPTSGLDHKYRGNVTGRKRQQRENRDFIQFHYDVSNEFYELFLDPGMVYSCAYFTDWGNSLEQAQFDKLDMICRKLQLQPGDRFLDIGCGWGGLLCHACDFYGVTPATGSALAQDQLQYASRESVLRYWTIGSNWESAMAPVWRANSTRSLDRHVRTRRN